ncbi:DUF2497 domain-containing protein [Lichenihabitans sp. Uapishka_5]|uniref:PopZ family protein n=1 Tax=Lichenihabitans sp. Uapishka_5 TaxID=3037302 RepID=UPI0029E7FB76|nr:DUF2497 domain-containing protein [Lichenihabitans sp. Uapishka_5]MDX7949932.1 DUF2497 domain-containing protein [Lichenihabitans sp. Uapishka_5]
MEDILASIRRIIAEDQSNNLARGSIGGLTRRAALAAAAEVRPAEDRQVQPEAEAPAIELPAPVYEPEIHVDHEIDTTAHDFGTPLEEPTPFHLDHMHGPETTFEPEPEPEHLGFQAHDAGQEVAYALPEPRDVGLESEPLMSHAAGASITSSFHALAETMVLQDPELIERVMRDSMRPLLKTWLDDHLPSIVERLVRTEIERVARGGRGRNG